MRPSDRNSYTNVAIRQLMRVQNQLASINDEGGIVALFERRMLEATLDAMRFKYRQKSNWDVLFGRS